MKVSNTNISNKNRGGHISMEHKHHKPHVHALPPHERQKLINIEFDSKDLSTLKKIFGDEDTATAAIEILEYAPPEIQILAIQIMKIIEEVA
nr:hypothetical protein [Ruminococcus bromii]